MNGDFCFSIGKTHKICQDYALSGKKDQEQFIIVSDGCSSSEDTDFGSRVLAKTCANLIKNEVDLDIKQLMTESQEVIWRLGLSKQSLDATLLLAHTKNDQCHIRMFGDGVLVKTRSNGNLEAVLIEYPSGAPNYLNYTTDSDRFNNYIDKFGLKKKTTSFKGESFLTRMFWETKEDESGDYYNEIVDIKDYSSISLLSDGVSSFYELVNNGTSKYCNDISWMSVLDKLLPFKNFQGEFVKRRVQKFEKETSNWHHADDFSLATIYLGS